MIAAGDPKLPHVSFASGADSTFSTSLAGPEPPSLNGADAIATAVNTEDPIWSVPNTVTLGTGGTVTLYTGTTPWTGLYSGNIVTGVTPIARSQAAPNYSPITREDPRYLEWGYTLGPSTMTTDGSVIVWSDPASTTSDRRSSRFASSNFSL